MSIDLVNLFSCNAAISPPLSHLVSRLHRLVEVDRIFCGVQRCLTLDRHDRDGRIEVDSIFRCLTHFHSRFLVG